MVLYGSSMGSVARRPLFHMVTTIFPSLIRKVSYKHIFTHLQIWPFCDGSHCVRHIYLYNYIMLVNYSVETISL